jgi:hypothetical protein
VASSQRIVRKDRQRIRSLRTPSYITLPEADNQSTDDGGGPVTPPTEKFLAVSAADLGLAPVKKSKRQQKWAAETARMRARVNVQSINFDSDSSAKESEEGPPPPARARTKKHKPPMIEQPMPTSSDESPTLTPQGSDDGVDMHLAPPVMHVDVNGTRSPMLTIPVDAPVPARLPISSSRREQVNLLKVQRGGRAVKFNSDISAGSGAEAEKARKKKALASGAEGTHGSDAAAPPVVLSENAVLKPSLKKTSPVKLRETAAAAKGTSAVPLPELENPADIAYRASEESTDETARVGRDKCASPTTQVPVTEDRVALPVRLRGKGVHMNSHQKIPPKKKKQKKRGPDTTSDTARYRGVEGAKTAAIKGAAAPSDDSSA